jgi:hypothetical protein
MAGNESDYGGGMYIETSAGIEIINCTIADNIARQWAGGFYTATFSFPELVNTIIRDNQALNYQNLFCSGDDSIYISFSDIEGGWEGEGNIDADPLFTDPINWNYQLSWANWPLSDSTKSPCIDTGSPETALDPDSTRADMGAFYFDQSLEAIQNLTIQIEGNGVRLTWETIPGALEYRLFTSDCPSPNSNWQYICAIVAPDTTVWIEYQFETGVFFNLRASN